MASAMRKMAVYLGLVEDDHRYDDRYADDYGPDEYDEYDDEGDLLDQGDRQETRAGYGDIGTENGRAAAERPAGTVMQTTDLARITTLHPAAGLIFGLRGNIERVTNKVFLLSPVNVEVAAEDKARIVERGFFNQS